MIKSAGTGKITGSRFFVVFYLLFFPCVDDYFTRIFVYGGFVEVFVFEFDGKTRVGQPCVDNVWLWFASVYLFNYYHCIKPCVIKLCMLE
jgi:hypothetical protein